MQVPGVYRRLRHVHHKDKGRGHGRPVHVFIGSHEVHGSLLQLIPVLEILSLPQAVEVRVKVGVRLVDLTAEITDPLLATLDKPNEGVHVGTTILAPDYWLGTVRDGWHWLTLLV